MTAARKYFYNAILMTAVSLLMRAVSVSFNVFVTGRLGADGMGLLTLVSSAYGFAVTFATSGISLAVTRMTAETVLTADGGEASRRLSYIARSSAAYCVIFGAAAGAALYFGADFIGGALLGDPRTVRCLRLLSFTLPPTALASAISGYFNACRRVYKNAVSDFVGQTLKIFTTSTLLAALLPRGEEYSLLAVVGGGAVAEAMSFFIAAFLFVRDRRRHFGADAKSAAPAADGGTELSTATASAAVRSLCGAALPVALSSYLRSGLVTLEHIMIPHALRRSGSSYTESLASYGTVHGMVMPVIMFPYAVIGPFSSLLVPELSESRARGQRERIRHIARSVFRVTLLFAVGVSGLMTAFSHELGMILYKSEEAGLYIRLLAPVIPVMYLDTAVDSMLKGLGEQLFCMRVNIADAAISIALIWLLVPRFGVYGYAVSVVACEVFNATLSILRLLRVADVEPHVIKWTLGPAAASVLSCSAVRYVISAAPRLYRADGALSLSLFMTSCAALYIMILTVTNVLTERDAAYVKRIFSG